jgi:hypothetical protein
VSTGYVAREGATSGRARSLFAQVSLRRAIGPGLVAALPQILALLFIVAAVAFVVGRMPIDGRGDYGQWLMTSRYYLGQDVPDYRTITALPPLIPFLLAALRVMVPDPGAALQVFNVALLLALVASVYLVASTVFADRLAGLFAIALAFLVTDRFLELFAFGGLLQAGALVFTLLSVAAFVQAGRDATATRMWWTLGGLSLALAGLSHVGTGLMAVPVCGVVALISAVRVLRHTPRRPLFNRGNAAPAALQPAERRPSRDGRPGRPGRRPRLLAPDPAAGERGIRHQPGKPQLPRGGSAPSCVRVLLADDAGHRHRPGLPDSRGRRGAPGPAVWTVRTPRGLVGHGLGRPARLDPGRGLD